MTTPFRTAPLPAAALLALAGVASAQPPAPPAGTYRPPAVAQPTLQTQAAVAPAATPILSAGPAVNPYAAGAFSPYGYPGFPTIQSPVQGYLSGAADVTNANGVYLQQMQQARIMQAQADSSRLDFRRKAIEQRQYEASLQPTTEQIRQQGQMDALQRARNNPPLTEIWSGAALNALLTAIQTEQGRGNVGPTVPVEPEVLAHVNLTAGTTYGGSGMLKNLTDLRWPRSLLDASFDDGRARVEQAVKKALAQAPMGPIDDATAQELDNALASILAGLKDAAPDLTPTAFIQGSRFLRELRGASAVLQDANVANFFSGKWRPQGSTVAELAAFLTSKGLTFAAAIAGDETYYTALHAAMVAYEYGLSRVASR